MLSWRGLLFFEPGEWSCDLTKQWRLLWLFSKTSKSDILSLKWSPLSPSSSCPFSWILRSGLSVRWFTLWTRSNSSVSSCWWQLKSPFSIDSVTILRETPLEWFLAFEQEVCNTEDSSVDEVQLLLHIARWLCLVCVMLLTEALSSSMVFRRCLFSFSSFSNRLQALSLTSSLRVCWPFDKHTNTQLVCKKLERN